MTFFTSTDQLISEFGDVASGEYIEIVHLTDTKVGFSIRHNYPQDIRYKPAIGQKTKKPDNIATIWVVYTHPDGAREPMTEEPVPLRIRIANMSRYRTENYDYDYQDIEGDCPSKASVEESAATPKPLDLEYPGEFFFIHAKNVFVDRKGKTVTGLEILKRVFDDHCKTVHLFWGIRLRMKLFAQDKFSGLFGALIAFMAFLLKHFFGRTLESNTAIAGLYAPYKPEALKKYDVDSLDILGYKTSKQVVVLFCVVVIVASLCRYGLGVNSDYWSRVGGNELMSLIHGLFLIWFLDVVVPWLLFWTINALILIRKFVLFMKIKGP